MFLMVVFIQVLNHLEWKPRLRSLDMISVKTYNELDLVTHFSNCDTVDNFTLFNHLKYIEWSGLILDGSKMVYVCLFDNDTIVGAIQLKIGGSDDFENAGFNNWVLGFSINNEYQGYGYSKVMIKEMFKYLGSISADNILISSYTEEGNERLRKNIRNESTLYTDIKFKDKD